MEEMCKNAKAPSLVESADPANVVAPIPPPTAPPMPTDVNSSNSNQINGKQTPVPTPPPAPAIPNPPEEELLGSVITITHNCPGTRASARVIQKMKLDQTRPMTPPPSEREHGGKKDEKSNQKTPSQLKSGGGAGGAGNDNSRGGSGGPGNGKTTWTNIERNCFFDALNEFGKDFESVANCINGKLKRRSSYNNDNYSFKTKDHVRQHYYQTYHKICKYVRYSEELKKPAQELYTLINYGEMRRKLQFLTEKHFMKLKQLVYHGQITVRCKGKNIRIKTPSCKALRRLNQLDDSLEDIRLPSKVEVLISPLNMESFGRVQSLAQNPRGRAIVPLHKKLISFIQTFEYKWRSVNQRLNEERLLALSGSSAPSSSSSASVSSTPNSSGEQQERQQPASLTTEPSLCFQPKPGVAIHRPLLNITAYLNSVNICLTAYEERLGVKVRSESLGNIVMTTTAANKRARTESGSDKRSPDTKKPKLLTSPTLEKSIDEVNPTTTTTTAVENNNVKVEISSGDELSEEIHEFLNGSIQEVEASAPITAPAPTPAPPPPPTTTTGSTTTTSASRAKRKEAKEAAAAAAARNFKPLVSDEIIKRIRKGWTVSNAADITVGDLYVVLGQDSKLELDYYWCEPAPAPAAATAAASSSNEQQHSGTPATPSSSTSSSSASASTTSLPYNTNDCDSVERVKAVTTSTVSNKLKHLLLVANLSERVRKRQCNCGHICDRKRDLMNKAQQLAAGGINDGHNTLSSGASSGGEIIFRTPMLPVRRPIANIMDPVRQLSSLTRQKNNRQVLVQRRILPPATMGRPYENLHVRQLHSSLFEPISSSTTTAVVSAVAVASKQNDEESTYDGDSSIIGRDMPTLDFCAPSTSSPSVLGVAEGLSSSSTVAINLPEASAAIQDETTSSTGEHFFNGSVSPMHLLRDSTSNARWLEDNINDFSLTSLLGHLDEIDATRDILDPSSSMSVISESSVDFRHKFQEIAALLQQQEKE
ncbi:protein cramped [Drosophila tropicalis]|uniref:protein cramped n=1 Tax=Drosophila tropicalis TaxID=46794 RepID=UPI0035AB802B